MRELIDESLKYIKIETPQDFLDVINNIASILGYWGFANPISGRRLIQFTPAKVRTKSYIDFDIPKKSGGMRKISAPVKPLKALQSSINLFLQSIFTPSTAATGFVVGKSVKDNAELHIGQTCIYNTDLENFFPSITKLMIRKALHKELGDIITSSEVINIICKICTVPNEEGIEVLPQGAPTSPILSNIVLKGMDEEMIRLAQRMKCRYSRYADDMTFSHRKQQRRMSKFWEERILKVIDKYGLKVNDKKTKTYAPGARMEVTGVTVSDKINVSRQYIKQLRTLLHLWTKYGYSNAQQIFVRDFCHGINKNLLNVIDGKINYLEMIKGKDNSTYRRYKRRFKTLMWKEKQLNNQKNEHHLSTRTFLQWKLQHS